MSNILKGNYALPEQPKKPEDPAAAGSGSGVERQFEAEALQKLGGSIAFIKKSSSFVWSGEPKKDDARPTSSR